MIILARYIKERFNVLLFVPLSVLLAAGGKTSGLTGPISLLVMSGYALVLLLWLRLLDDLCSREQDQERAPKRITVEVYNARTLWKWFFVLALVSLVMACLLHNGRGLLVVSLLALFLGVVYLVRRRLNRIVFDLIVLLKYPAIALAVSAETGPLAAVVLHMILIYLILVVYEVFHDKTHLADRRYLVPGLIAWVSLSICFAGFIVVSEGNSPFGSLVWSLPFACFGLFLLAATCERIRGKRIIPFVNGIIYLGLMI